MKNLEKYYGKELVYIITKFKNDKIETTKQTKKVYNPKDLNCRVRPSDGCDLVIGDNSANSKNIFDVGGIDNSVSAFTVGRWDEITLLNYCTPEQSDQVEAEHVQVIKNTIYDYITKEQNRVNKYKAVLLNI